MQTKMIPRTASYQVRSLFFQVTTCFSLNSTSEHEHFDHFLFFSQLCAKFQALGSFELHATIFSNLVKMALPSGRILSRLLRRMKAFIDEFRPNTSQANYFGGFWRITSEINAVKSVPRSFLPSKLCLFWWLISVNSCLLVFNSIFHRETKK